MNELQIFSNQEFGEIRTAVTEGEPLFCLADVCNALGLSNVTEVRKRLNEKGVSSIETLTNGGIQFMVYIDEGNLYKTIFQSRKKSADKFVEWISREVLPSIRKNGGYIAGQEYLTDDELLAKALVVAQNKIADRDKLIKEQQEHIERARPKEIFADAVAASKSSILIGELAKILRQNGIDTGEKRLFDWMRRQGYLIRRGGTDYNMPTQRSMELKLLEIRERTINNPDGSIRITRTTLVTGKGQQYFINKFMDKQKRQMPG